LKYTAHAGVGPGLKHSDQTALGVNRFYRPYGLAHSSGVMGKIIDHRNLPFFAPDFLPPLYPIKGFQGTGDDLQWNFQMVRNGDNRQRIEQIVFAEKFVLKTEKVSLFFMISKVVQGDSTEMVPRRQQELLFWP
jgi:hypothetical protein